MNAKGQSLTEIIVAIALIAIVFGSAWAVIQNSVVNIALESSYQKAHYLVIGGLEGIRSMRNENWNILTDGSWHFEYDESDPLNEILVLIAGEEVIDGYSREVIIESVRRDSEFKISEDLADDIDPNTKKITVTVSWNVGSRVYVDEESIYLTNWENF